MKKTQVLIVGAGHNGLIAANYLSRIGVQVMVAEAKDSCGGASVSQQVFEEFDARLSRYSYLIALLPHQIIEELELDFETIPRRISSFTPFVENGVEKGLLVESSEVGDLADNKERNRKHFAEVFGSESAYEEWDSFYSEVYHFAQAVAPTLLHKLPTRSELKKLVSHPIWDELIEQPLGKTLESRFTNDLMRGIVLSDGLIGTDTDAHDFAANICFLYHLIGNGTGEWRVPRGGMGNLVAQLENKARAHGAEILVNHKAISIEPSSPSNPLTTVHFENGEIVECEYLLFAAAPQILHHLVEGNSKSISSRDGSQMKINMLLKSLPRLKNGAKPEDAFAGTFHINESYEQLQKAFAQSSQGIIPDEIPGEIYCHTLSDSSILSPELVAAGYHTLTLFVIHTPARLFDENHDENKAIVVKRILNGLSSYLEQPIENYLATNEDGSFAIEAKTPQELEKEISLPRGNIFHKDLSLPFREDHEPSGWGVETEFDNILLIGAGARRGGGVSGIPGRNGACAIAEKLGLSV